MPARLYGLGQFLRAIASGAGSDSITTKRVLRARLDAQRLVPPAQRQ